MGHLAAFEEGKRIPVNAHIEFDQLFSRRAVGEPQVERESMHSEIDPTTD
jgi:hypothetical protein